jgi:hypothetical protein
MGHGRAGRAELEGEKGLRGPEPFEESHGAPRLHGGRTLRAAGRTGAPACGIIPGHGGERLRPDAIRVLLRAEVPGGLVKPWETTVANSNYALAA